MDLLLNMNQTQYGKSIGYEDAYREGYAAKYEEWLVRTNPYPEDTEEFRGYEDGYCEAVLFS